MSQVNNNTLINKRRRKVKNPVIAPTKPNSSSNTNSEKPEIKLDYIPSTEESESKVVSPFPTIDETKESVEYVEEIKLALEKTMVSPFPLISKAELPEKYRNMPFDYHFVDEVTHGRAHPLRHNSSLKLTAHIPSSAFLKSTPSSHSLRHYVSRVLNQGNIGACVAHSGVQAIHIVMHRRETSRGWMAKMFLGSKGFYYGSRLFLYDNARRVDGTSLSQDIGCTNISACLALEQYKICEEDLWPYIESNYSIPPPHNAYVAASKHTTFRYSVVSQDVESIKRAIASGHPVMFGIVVFPSFIHSGLDGRRGDADGYPHHSERTIGGHSLLLIGYDDDRQRFTFVNHWGESWGDGGFGTLPYRFVTDPDYVGDLCAIEYFE